MTQSEPARRHIRLYMAEGTEGQPVRIPRAATPSADCLRIGRNQGIPSAPAPYLAGRQYRRGLFQVLFLNHIVTKPWV